MNRHGKQIGYVIKHIGGNCPVQAEGVVDNHWFYFRARGESWQMHIAELDDGIFEDGEWYYEEDYKVGEQFAAGWMGRDEAIRFMEKAFSIWRSSLEKLSQ